jgi:hypothetical protein
MKPHAVRRPFLFAVRNDFVSGLLRLKSYPLSSVLHQVRFELLRKTDSQACGASPFVECSFLHFKDPVLNHKVCYKNTF